jgi:hypothetical protein
MTDKQLVEFSNPFSWDRRSTALEDNAQQPHLVRPLKFGATRRRGFIVGLRSRLYTLALLLAGAFIFISGSLCAIFILVDDHCGPAYGHYGCEILTKTESLASGKN